MGNIPTTKQDHEAWQSLGNWLVGWFAVCSLDRSAEHTIASSLPCYKKMYTRRLNNEAQRIIYYFSHIDNVLFYQLQSGRRYRIYKWPDV